MPRGEEYLDIKPGWIAVLGALLKIFLSILTKPRLAREEKQKTALDN